MGADRLELVMYLKRKISELARTSTLRKSPYFKILEEKYQFIRERYNSALEAQQVRDFIWLHEEIVQALSMAQALALKLRIIKCANYEKIKSEKRRIKRSSKRLVRRRTTATVSDLDSMWQSE